MGKPCRAYTIQDVDRSTGELAQVPRYEWRGNTTGKRHQFRCMSWRCPDCRPILVKKIRYRIGHWGQYHGLTRFWTLTLDPSKMTDEVLSKYGNPQTEWTRCAALYMSAVWNKFLVCLKRRYPKLKYIAVREFHKNMKVMHYHILVNGYIPQEWMSAKWERYGGGFYTYVKYVDVHRVAAYIAPYVTKMGAIECSEWPERIRRYCVCRDIHMEYTPKQWENKPKHPDECAFIDTPDNSNKKGGCARCPYRRHCTLRPETERYTLYYCGLPVGGPSGPPPKPQSEHTALKSLRLISRAYNKAWSAGSGMTERLRLQTERTINRLFK